METATDKLTLDRQLADWYFNNRDRLMSASSTVFNAVRPAAMESFRKLGIPDRTLESYRSTDILQAFSPQLNRYIDQKKILFSVEDLFTCDIPDLDTELFLLVNGWFYENRPRIQELPGGIIAGSMAEAARRYPGLMEPWYSRLADHEKDGLVALNTAFAQDGTFIYVPPGVESERAIQVVNILLSPEDLFVQHRNLVVVGENASARILVCDHSLSGHNYLTNSVTEIYAGPNARVDYIRLQNENNNSRQVSSTFIRQEESSNVMFNTITLHGGMIRNNVYTRLNGRGASSQTLGLSLVDQTQHVDNFTFVDHAVPECTSRQNFKSILDDQATGAFTGRILVRQDAQKTSAYQASNNILLTTEARMSTRPQLEIYADDVKCSHGATVGQLDPNAIFYLRSRGIALREARLLMMYAFGNEILGKISSDPLRERLSELVEKRLRGELTRCNSCPLHCQETC